MKPDGLEKIWNGLKEQESRLCGGFPFLVREKYPLVHLITNYVTVNDCVNSLLAIGAKGICSHGLKEAAQVTKGCDALVCNLGATEYYEAMERSAEQASLSRIPIVIDPVGCSASDLRRSMCMHMVRDYDISAVRGNYAEITALADEHFSSSGLDSKASLKPEQASDFKEKMLAFSKEHGLILIASGKTDLCTDGNDFLEIEGGTAAFRRITGSGCMSSSILAAYLAAQNSIQSAASALKFIGLCGQAAHMAVFESKTGAGHFHMFFMDALSVYDEIWEHEDHDS